LLWLFPFRILPNMLSSLFFTFLKACWLSELFFTISISILDKFSISTNFLYCFLAKKALSIACYSWIVWFFLCTYSIIFYFDLDSPNTIASLFWRLYSILYSFNDSIFLWLILDCFVICLWISSFFKVRCYKFAWDCLMIDSLRSLFFFFLSSNFSLSTFFN